MLERTVVNGEKRHFRRRYGATQAAVQVLHITQITASSIYRANLGQLALCVIVNLGQLASSSYVL